MERQRALDEFERYTRAYDAANPRIALKIEHTLRVAELCARIAASCALTDDDVDLAWLIGLLHDIGRFEQLRRFDSFRDAETVDHAALGVQVLFGDTTTDSPLIRRFIDEADNDALIAQAIASHSAYRLPDDLDARTLRLCQILRDADKIDIIKVNGTCPIEDIYNVSERTMRESALTSACVEIFYEHRCLPRGVRRFPADILLGHICFAWELVFDESLRIMREQGYLHEMLRRDWDNPATQAAFAEMAAHMEAECGI